MPLLSLTELRIIGGMGTRLPFQDGGLFLAKLEQAAAEGNADFVEANLDRLKSHGH